MCSIISFFCGKCGANMLGTAFYSNGLHVGKLEKFKYLFFVKTRKKAQNTRKQLKSLEKVH